jgi:hypothetical protein
MNPASSPGGSHALSILGVWVAGGALAMLGHSSGRNWRRGCRARADSISGISSRGGVRLRVGAACDPDRRYGGRGGDVRGTIGRSAAFLER